MRALMTAFHRQESVIPNTPPPVAVDDLAGEFLVCCLAARCLPADRRPGALDTVRALAAGEAFDWQRVYRRALEERVAPLLHTVLDDEVFVPPAVRRQLEEAYLATARRNLLLFHELEAALSALKEAGVDVLVLKGGALVETVYDNIAVRPLMDFDLLVHREGAAQVIEMLSALGYEQTRVEPHMGLTLRHGNELLLRKQGLIDVHLELHWSLFDSPHYQERLPMAWFWEKVIPGAATGGLAAVLGPEAQLLHLCGHLMLHHRGDELLWLHDVAELLCVYDGRIAWSQVLEMAEACDLVLPVQRVVSAVAAGWGAPVPAGVLARLADMTPSPAEAQVFSWLSGEERPVLERFWADLASMPSWSERFSYALRQLFPSRRYMRHRYGVSQPLLLPLTYPYRWALGLYRAIVPGADE